MAGIHVGDIGTELTMTITENGSFVDISGAQSKDFHFEKPGGNEIIKSASFVTDGSDGQLQYTVQDGDLDESGLWAIQAEIVDSEGNTFHSDIKTFQVDENII